MGDAAHRLRTLGEDGGDSSCGKTLVEPSGPTQPSVDSVGLLSTSWNGCWGALPFWRGGRSLGLTCQPREVIYLFFLRIVQWVSRPYRVSSLHTVTGGIVNERQAGSGSSMSASHSVVPANMLGPSHHTWSWCDFPVGPTCESWRKQALQLHQPTQGPYGPDSTVRA